MTTWQQRVFNLRVLLGLTQKELAQRLGVTPNSVGNWEKGTYIPRQRLQATIEIMEEKGGKQ